MVVSSIEHAHSETKEPKARPYSKGHMQNAKSNKRDDGITRLSSLSTSPNGDYPQWSRQIVGRGPRPRV